MLKVLLNMLNISNDIIMYNKMVRNCFCGNNDLIDKIKLNTEKCEGKNRKIAVVVDPDQDYHFYRQDSDGYWSHKPGATKVTRLDTSGRLIYDPFLAARDNKASNLNYEQFCGYMCVPSDTNKINLKRGGRHSKKALAHHSKKALARHSKKR